jgi:hypothetical protein
MEIEIMKPVLLAALFGAAISTGAVADPLTVVELYQSQGCSSCPPAIRNVNALAEKPNILPLMFAVTYWDRLGWKDTFARPEFTGRQWAYAPGLHRHEVYTPQVVVNGQTDLTGTDPLELMKALRGAKALSGPAVTVAEGTVHVAAGASTKADVWLVRYDPRTIPVEIGAGENSGVTIAHRNIVRQLIRLGGWQGAAASFAIPANPEKAWRTAILIQGENGRAILSAAVL